MGSQGRLWSRAALGLRASTLRGLVQWRLNCLQRCWWEPRPGMSCNPTTSPQPLISSVITGKALPILEFPHLQNRLRDQKTYFEVLPSLGFCGSGHPAYCMLSDRDLKEGCPSSHPVIGPASRRTSLPSHPGCLLHVTEPFTSRLPGCTLA